MHDHRSPKRGRSAIVRVVSDDAAPNPFLLVLRPWASAPNERMVT